MGRDVTSFFWKRDVREFWETNRHCATDGYIDDTRTNERTNGLDARHEKRRVNDEVRETRRRGAMMKGDSGRGVRKSKRRAMARFLVAEKSKPRSFDRLIAMPVIDGK